MNEITASQETLVEQAPGITASYLAAATRHIDGQYGDGFAETHPELLGAFVVACAMDVAAVTLAQQIRVGLQGIADAT